jgi:transcriptional regulator with XRE-family HTH domain
MSYSKMAPEGQFRSIHIDIEQVGRRLVAIRKDRNMTEQQLGDVIGVSRSEIWQYEHGRIRVVLLRLGDIARALHCKRADLLQPLDAPLPQLPRRGFRPRPGAEQTRDSLLLPRGVHRGH